MIFHEAILKKHHILFFSKIGKDVANLSSAAVVIGPLRVKGSTITIGSNVHV